MNTGDVIGLIVVPIAIFLLTAGASGIVALVKLISYFNASKAAQESTASSNTQIVERLDGYIGQTDSRLNDHGERISVLEYAGGIKPRPETRRDGK